MTLRSLSNPNHSLPHSSIPAGLSHFSCSRPTVPSPKKGDLQGRRGNGRGCGAAPRLRVDLCPSGEDLEPGLSTRSTAGTGNSPSACSALQEPAQLRCFLFSLSGIFIFSHLLLVSFSTNQPLLHGDIVKPQNSHFSPILCRVWSWGWALQPCPVPTDGDINPPQKKTHLNPKIHLFIQSYFPEGAGKSPPVIFGRVWSRG